MRKVEQFGGVLLKVDGNPEPLELERTSEFFHEVEIDNQWPHSIDEIETYVRATKGMFAGPTPSARIRIAQIRSLVKTDPVGFLFKATNYACSGADEEISTTLAFHDATQRSGMTYAGNKRIIIAEYTVDLV